MKTSLSGDEPLGAVLARSRAGLPGLQDGGAMVEATFCAAQVTAGLKEGAALFVFLHGLVAFNHVEADKPADFHEREDAPAHEILDGPDAAAIVISQLLLVSPRTDRVRICSLPLAFVHAF